MLDVRTRGEKLFDIFNILLMCFLIFITIYPIYYVVCASFSDARELLKLSGPLAAPLRPWTLEGYRLTLGRDIGLLKGFGNTLTYVLGGTALSLILTTLGAFVVTRRTFLLRGAMMKLVLVPMFFSGGLIPLYFVIRGLGLYDTGWVMVLPYCVSSYNLIIMRTFFQSLPQGLEESALLDGANDAQVLVHVVLPLSSAVLAVIALYYAVAYWNSWYPAMIFMRDATHYPLQMLLRNILIENTMQSDTGAEMSAAAYNRELIKYCTVVISTVPILVVYPFLQRYFVKGVMIGAIKE